MSVLPLRSKTQHYAWGSPTSIPALLGIDNPEGLPCAELWLGAHPRASSVLAGGQPLCDYLAGQGLELPFLFKILAAASPLSLQCHPTRAQALAGFAREEAAGIAIDAGNRNYRDQNHKPEIIVALTEFWALKGFRTETEIAELFQRAGIGEFARGLSGGLERFYKELFSSSSEERDSLLRALAVGRHQLPSAEAHWTGEFLRLYPADLGACAALFLQLVLLQPGQGLALGAGELHAYLEGTGLELMANSDNVLRGGLTSKHVDVEELIRVLRFEHIPLEILGPDQAESYASEGGEFQLSHVRLDQARVRTPTSMEIWLCLGERAELRFGDGVHEMQRGHAAFVSADTGTIAIEGKGELWIASALTATT